MRRSPNGYSSFRLLVLSGRVMDVTGQRKKSVANISKYHGYTYTNVVLLFLLSKFICHRIFEPSLLGARLGGIRLNSNPESGVNSLMNVQFTRNDI